MSRFWRTFLFWSLLIAAVWVVANLPRDGGSLKRFISWAGFPWTFAVWVGGRLERFDWVSLAGDVGVGLVLAALAAAACAWSRR